MKRLAVYTVQTGSKGDFEGFGIEPNENFDLILFTDDHALRADGVDVRLIDAHGLDPARSSRLPKLVPHRYLPDYEWSLYVDSNCRLKQAPSKLLDLCVTEPFAFFSFKHPQRTCLYDEAEVVIGHDYDDERRVREQLDHYRRLGFPRGEGLITATVLLRRHHDEETARVGEEWFEQVLRFSKRDQLSFNFVAWRHSFCHGYLQGSVRDNEYILWPARPRNQRITADFDPKVYAWLNPEVEASGVSPEEHFLQQRRSGVSPGRYKRHSWQLRKLANKHKSDKGDIYFNAHSYADIYELMLQPRREEPLRVLELGLLRHDVQAKNPGGPYAEAPSLAMWREFLPNATIWGFDIADFSKVPPLPGVTIVRGDMGSEADLARLIETAGGGFDVIIDDGSHASHHQQIPLAFLFAHLNPRGLYFIEDLHHQPNQLEPEGAIKTLHVLRSLACGKIVPTPYIDQATLEGIERSTSTIRFFDSWDRSLGKIHTDALAVLSKARRRKLVEATAAAKAVKIEAVELAQPIETVQAASPVPSRVEARLIRKFGRYAAASGWIRSQVEKGPVDKDGRPLPWYSYVSIRFLSERVRDDMNVFEFGSGNSTLWWAERVKTVTSVEHDAGWAKTVQQRLPGNVSYNNVQLEEGGEYSQFARISGNGPFDVVVIDGRDRVNCAINSMNELKEDGVLIFDNAHRKRYQPAYEILSQAGFKRLKFIGIGALAVDEWDTSIFYRRTNCLGI